MATNIVPSLFGLTPLQVRQQQLSQDRQLTNEYASTYSNEFARRNAMRGGMLGSALVRGAAGLFGIQTAEEDRASQMQEALQSAMAALPPEQRNDRAAVMNKVSEMLMGNPDMQREGIEAQFQANAFNLEDTSTRAKTASYLASEESAKAASNLNSVRARQEVLDNKAKELQVQGQFAVGALDAYKKNTSPDAKARVWNNTIKSFEGLGIDTELIKDLPEGERQNYLEQVVQSSKTSADRIKEDYNVSNMQYKQSRLDLDATKFKRAQTFKETQANINNTLKQSLANLNSEKFDFEKKKVLFNQADDLLRSNERQLDDVRKDLQDDIDERTKLETGKQFGLSEEETILRKQELDARIKQGRATVKQGELLLNQGRKQLDSVKFNPTPGVAAEPTPGKAPANKPYISDAEAKKMLGAKYKPGYKFYIEGGRIKGDPV